MGEDFISNDIPFGPVPDLKNLEKWLRKMSAHIEIQDMKMKIMRNQVEKLSKEVHDLTRKLKSKD